MTLHFNYTKTPVAIDRLSLEVQQSSITIALDYINTLGDQLDVYFKADLSSGEVTLLDAIVANHAGNPLPVNDTQHVELTSPSDTDNRPQFRLVATKPEFHYTPRSIDFYTSKHKSLYNRTHFGDGSIDGAPDIGDVIMKYYDTDNVQLVQGETESDGDYQIRLTAACTKTVMRFEPSFNYDVFGAKLQFRDIPSDRAYFWFVAAPDVPVEYGGNVVFMGGGMNISFFGERDTFECDGKTVSTITYDGTYHSGAVALIVKHNVGLQIGVQLIYQFYSA